MIGRCKWCDGLLRRGDHSACEYEENVELSDARKAYPNSYVDNRGNVVLQVPGLPASEPAPKPREEREPGPVVIPMYAFLAQGMSPAEAIFAMHLMGGRLVRR